MCVCLAPEAHRNADSCQKCTISGAYGAQKRVFLAKTLQIWQEIAFLCVELSTRWAEDRWRLGIPNSAGTPLLGQTLDDIMLEGAPMGTRGVNSNKV